MINRTEIKNSGVYAAIITAVFMEEKRIMKKTGQGATRLIVVLCAGLLLLVVGCNDLFHTEQSEEKPKVYPEVPGDLSLDDALAWLSTHVEAGGAYTITLRDDETIAPKMLSYSGKTVIIILTGGTTEKIVSLSTTGALFTVGNGVTLTLNNNVTLRGRSDNTTSLVWVNSGGRLVMNAGSKVTGNSSSSYSYGGGVYVNSGTFTMNGGTISGNSAANYGGGVYVDNGGTFTMSGGTISGNSASWAGGGVYAGGGTFIKHTGGVIYGLDESNIALRNVAGTIAGHVVYVSSYTKRDTTAFMGTTMDTRKYGSAGGWE
jgi:hypothetical protein